MKTFALAWLVPACAWHAQAQTGPTVKPTSLSFAYQLNSSTLPASVKLTVTLPTAIASLPVKVTPDHDWLIVTPGPRLFAAGVYGRRQRLRPYSGNLYGNDHGGYHPDARGGVRAGGPLHFEPSCIAASELAVGVLQPGDQRHCRIDVVRVHDRRVGDHPGSDRDRRVLQRRQHPVRRHRHEWDGRHGRMAPRQPL